eukprot:7310175-Prymnesium_polylepis.2
MHAPSTAANTPVRAHWHTTQGGAPSATAAAERTRLGRLLTVSACVPARPICRGVLECSTIGRRHAVVLPLMCLVKSEADKVWREGCLACWVSIVVGDLHLHRSAYLLVEGWAHALERLCPLAACRYHRSGHEGRVTESAVQPCKATVVCSSADVKETTAPYGNRGASGLWPTAWRTSEDVAACSCPLIVTSTDLVSNAVDGSPLSFGGERQSRCSSSCHVASTAGSPAHLHSNPFVSPPRSESPAPLRRTSVPPVTGPPGGSSCRTNSPYMASSTRPHVPALGRPVPVGWRGALNSAGAHNGCIHLTVQVAEPATHVTQCLQPEPFQQHRCVSSERSTAWCKRVDAPDRGVVVAVRHSTVREVLAVDSHLDCHVPPVK